MKEVTRKEYYDYIGPREVTGRHVDSKWPYTTEHRHASGRLAGRIVGEEQGSVAVYHYYIQGEA